MPLFLAYCFELRLPSFALHDADECFSAVLPATVLGLACTVLAKGTLNQLVLFRVDGEVDLPLVLQILLDRICDSSLANLLFGLCQILSNTSEAEGLDQVDRVSLVVAQTLEVPVGVVVLTGCARRERHLFFNQMGERLIPKQLPELSVFDPRQNLPHLEERSGDLFVQTDQSVQQAPCVLLLTH